MDRKSCLPVASKEEEEKNIHLMQNAQKIRKCRGLFFFFFLAGGSK